MKLRVLLCCFLIIILTACSPTTQTVVSDKETFYGVGEYWTVSYIYNPKLYDEKKVNWVEIEPKGFEVSQEDLSNIDIEIESRDALITGNVGDMVTEMDGNVLSFLVGTVNFETYEEDEYKITINFNDRHDVIKLQLER
ncbi:hypothetical protein [Halalkalibacter krulwichiae]|uniref:Lipoprotein n=1 Tax=Halalkalibacter krulwichiae TaxID=199441 RepID=A0A1X9MID9_9BACI|nr:hypothetical protein [Halalkalibacter krulwichiae]ARK32544.1 hypothetical protein BkAM31D_23220 [Halalkalibacter krulwichiae]